MEYWTKQEAMRGTEQQVTISPKDVRRDNVFQHQGFLPTQGQDIEVHRSMCVRWSG